MPPMMDDKISITFDDEFRLRVLDSDKYKQTESLNDECTAFVSKIQEFNTTVRRSKFAAAYQYAS